MTVSELLDNEDTKVGEKKKGNFNLTAGVSNNGLNLECLRKNILKANDFSKIAFKIN